METTTCTEKSSPNFIIFDKFYRKLDKTSDNFIIEDIHMKKFIETKFSHINSEKIEKKIEFQDDTSNLMNNYKKEIDQIENIDMVSDETSYNYIDINRRTMLDFHGKYIFIFTHDHVDLFELEAIKNSIYHPLTGVILPKNVIKYIELHDKCYTETKNLDLSAETLNNLYDWYQKSRKKGFSVQYLATQPETMQAYNIVKYYMTATDFQSHFKNFNPNDSNQERYERDLAEKALHEQKTPGSWLLRHSSYNRPIDENTTEFFRKCGIRYYVLSYIDKIAQIQHVLLMYRVGMGWQYKTYWYSTFLDCLEAILHINGIPFSKRIEGYITDPDI